MLTPRSSLEERAEKVCNTQSVVVSILYYVLTSHCFPAVRVNSEGLVKIQFNVITKDMASFGKNIELLSRNSVVHCTYVSGTKSYVSVAGYSDGLGKTSFEVRFVV